MDRRHFLQFFLLGAGLVACQTSVTTDSSPSSEASTSPTSGSQDALDEIKARGKMIVAIDPTFAPFEYTDASGKIVGYDPAILELIAKDLGVEIEYQQMAFSGIIPGLIAGSFDFTASALSVTAERAQKIDFTLPMAEGVNVVLKRADDASITTDVASLAGKRIGVKANTQPEQVMKGISDELVAQGKTAIEFLSIDTVEQTISALATKRVDFVVDDQIVLAQVVRERPEAKLEIVGPVGPKTYISWGTNKSDPKLNAYLNEQIKKLKADGTLKELQSEHFFGITFDQLPESDFIPAS
jgi:polar amino acid transport system substrate-binding protein